MPCQFGQVALDAVHFHRGLLKDTIALTPTQLLLYANTCWPWLPYPRLYLSAKHAEPDVLEFDRLIRVCHLKLGVVHGYEDIWSLLGSPHLCNLDVLDMTESVIAAGNLTNLLKPGWFPKLREVRLAVYDPEAHLIAAFETTMPHALMSPALRSLEKQLEGRFEKVDLRSIS